MKNLSAEKRKQHLLTIFNAAVSAVSGQQAVERAIDNDSAYDPEVIIAVGKAAVGMCRGALNRFPNAKQAFVVTKYDHADDDILSRQNVTVMETAHPVPDSQSLKAGDELRSLVQSLAADSRLLLLVSGGASALSESLPDGMSLEDLQAITDDMLSTGKTIGEINSRRKEFSQIKNGKLLAQFKGAEIRVYAISDVEGDSIATIGSGLGDCHRAQVKANSSIIASNQISRDKAQVIATSLDLEVNLNEESLYGDVFELAKRIGSILKTAKSGVYIWGGEPTIILPDKPGQGGRNQSLALALSEFIKGRNDITILVAGTDGTDGPTNAAGGIVDGSTYGDSAAVTDSLQRADAGSYLLKQNNLLITGPTNTNVMDLAIAIID
ncbi:MAG: hydroxypyruvate reductase [Gammaproteobacteria bacterium]|jgi:hydroxypyruvate reductase